MSPRLGATGLLLLALLAGPASAAEHNESSVPVSPPVFQAPSIRSTSQGFAGLIEHGTRRSTVFRSLIDQLNASDLIVYVRCSNELTATSRMTGKLSFVSKVPGWRFLVIELLCPLDRDRQLKYLAHELQHAVEIASAASVQDEASLMEYYSRHGFLSSCDTERRRAFETQAARDVADQVWREITTTPRDGSAR